MMNDETIDKILYDALANEYCEECTISLDEPLKPREYLYSWKGVKFGERGTIMNVRGFPGIGKTFAVTAFCAAFLTGNNGGLSSYAQPNERVLFVDTEQTHNSTLKIVKRIKKDFPNTEDRLKLLNIRNVLPIDRMEYLEFEIGEYKPSLIVVDGFAGLIKGMGNNEQELAEEVDNAITRLFRIAKEYNALSLTTTSYISNYNNPYHDWFKAFITRKSYIEFTLKRLKRQEGRVLIPNYAKKEEPKRIHFDIVNTEDHLGKVIIK